MATLAVGIRPATARNVVVTDETVIVELDDGRTISAPTAWYPRLFHATPEERNNWRLIAKGEGIHWPDLDEDISIENILFGEPSGESQRSFKQWLDARQTRER
ncbi:MAG: DUF2442 domain-containing protein [Desulfomonilaceae bacterium]